MTKSSVDLIAVKFDSCEPEWMKRVECTTQIPLVASVEPAHVVKQDSHLMRRPAGVDDPAFVPALRAGKLWARRCLYVTYGFHVARILRRILGRDPELQDVVQDVFIEAYTSASGLREASALKAWLSRITVFTARAKIRRRQVRRLVRFWDPGQLPEHQAPVAGGSTLDALGRAHALLDRLGADERIVFVLRFIEGLGLREIATTCGCSLPTVKRRLSSAQKAFVDAAHEEPAMARWLRAGRWAGLPRGAVAAASNETSAVSDALGALFSESEDA